MVIASASNCFTPCTTGKCWGRHGPQILQENQQKEACRNCTVTALLAELNSCSRTQDLPRGKQVHAKAVDCGHDSNTYVASAIINMYSKCGNTGCARQVFDGMEHPDVASWNAILLGYANNGQGVTALELFRIMRREGTAPDSLTFVAALKSCTSLDVAECRKHGRAIHCLAVQSSCDLDPYVQSSLIDMYAKCGLIADARRQFEAMQRPDVVSWTALIMGYANNREGLSALHLFARMTVEGLEPDYVTFAAALKACTSLAVDQGAQECGKNGRALHKLAVESGCSDNICIASSLIDMYAKCGSMLSAHQVFATLDHPNVVTWTSLILGYAENGQAATALKLFARMSRDGPAPNSVTFVAVLRACIVLALQGTSWWAECVDLGKAIHNLVTKNGSASNAYVGSTMIDMYAKCGCMDHARRVFDRTRSPQVVAWTALILGYAGQGQGLTSLDLFVRMTIDGPVPDSVTFVAALKACTSLAVNEGACGFSDCSHLGKAVHRLAVESGCSLNPFVHSMLIDMYAKCNCLVYARQVFDQSSPRDVVSWNALLLGYVSGGQGLAALDIFARMRAQGPAPDSVTFSGALKACALLGALEIGRSIHSQIISRNKLTPGLLTSLVEFYAKCGSLVEAQSVFDLHAEARDVRTWNGLLAGFSSCGDIGSVFQLFERMQDAGFQPDAVTFLCILTCCSHAGLVDKARQCFDSMSTKYRVVPSIEHYNCMIDALGRANRLDEAMTLVESMPCSPNDVTWITVLAACRKWKNVKIGRLAFQSLMNFKDKAAVAHVLMEQIYHSRGMMREQEMECEFLKVTQESCWTSELGEVHTFVT